MTATANEPDLRSPRVRVLECAACSEPAWGEPSGMTLRLHCGYCGHDDVRDLAPPIAATPPEEAYRGTARSHPPRPQKTDLVDAPEGFPRRPTVGQIRDYLAAAMKELATLEFDGDERAAVEYRILYAAATLSAVCLGKHDQLRARAVLETALETHRLPIYRALVLCRLARIAAFGDAPELAERWLSAIPEGLRVAEVSANVRLARAMLARSRGDAKAMLDELGPEEAFGPNTRVLGMALRVDALERTGDIGKAREAYTRGARGQALVFANTLSSFALAPRTRKRSQLVGFGAMGLIAVAFCAMGFAFHGDTLVAFGVLGTVAVGAIVLKQF